MSSEYTFPHGNRTASTVAFSSYGNYTDYWSTTEKSATQVWVCNLGFNYASSPSVYNGKNYGISVRCLKD